jgi:fructoselysine-6-P-deglycase FrlB-like protein
MAWAPHIQKTSDILYAYCISPRKVTQMYANMISSFAGNTIAVTRLTNNMMFANMDAFKTSIQQAKDNAKELSRVGVNAARSFEQTSRDASRLG